MRIYGFIFAIILNILPTWAQETREQFRDSLKAATEHTIRAVGLCQERV